MVNDEKYIEILDSGLTLDHYMILCNVKNKVKLVDNKRIQGFLNLLIKKGYIENDELTDKGIDLVENCEFSEIIKVVRQNSEEEEIDIGNWMLSVHAKCEEKITKLTGGKQVKARFDKKFFNFMPNPVDFARNLSKVITLYKLKDYDKIERTLLNYIDTCNDTSNWFPILYNYIYQFNKKMSQMVTDMDSLTDKSDDTVDYVRHKLL